MQAGGIFFVIALNGVIIFLLYIWQQKALENRIKHLKKEVQDLEDLVAAIIEEFEEIAEANESRLTEVQNVLSGVSSPGGSLAGEENPAVEAEVTTDFYQESTGADTSADLNGAEILPEAVNIVVPNSAETVDSRVKAASNTGYFRPVNDPKHQRILNLWEQGVSIEEIAKQLAIGRGEVQLILGIYRRS